MPLGINSMAGTDVCQTRRRRRNPPCASDIKQYCGRLPLFGTRRRGQQDLVTYVISPSLTCKAVPFTYKRGYTLSQRIDRSVHSHTTTEPLGSNLEHMLEHLAHSRAPITLSPSDQSPTRLLAPPISLPSVCNPTANFEHLGSGIKSPTDSNWT